MEQNRLGMHEMLHHEHQSLHDQHFSNSSANLKPQKVSLRSMSKSDPHLNIPHFMMSQDEQHPSLNKIVSNIFHPDTVLNSVSHLHVEGAPAMSNIGSGHHEQNLKGSESSAQLLRESATTPALRKSSSAVGWSFSDKGQGLSTWTCDSSLKSSTTSYLPGLALNRPSDYHSQGGLVMSSNTDSKNMSVLVSAAPSQNPFSQTLASSVASSSSAQAQINPLEPAHIDDRSKSTGFGVFGMFRQGFLGRPVIRSDEEQYRYIMALDR